MDILTKNTIVTKKICEFLDSRTIQYTFHSDILCINRTSMIENSPKLSIRTVDWEHAVYTYVLESIRKHVNDPDIRLVWSMQTDDWYSIGMYGLTIT